MGTLTAHFSVSAQGTLKGNCFDLVTKPVWEDEVF